MDKNGVLEIYDEDYIKECKYREQLKISVNKGVDFLLNKQLNYGEFKTEICNRYKDSSGQVVEEWTFDSSPFATALILYSLTFIEEDERVQKLREQGLKFLMDEMEEGGLWRYWSSKNEKHRMIPPDLDDICCISHILKINNIPFPENTQTILNNKNKQDIFNTWLLSVPGENVVYSNNNWIINQEDDICCVVNSNVLLYLGEIKETEKVIEYLVQVTLKGAETTSTKGAETTSTSFYNHELSFYYMLSKAYYNGALSLNTVKETVVNRILNTQHSDGSFGNELLTSLAICSLLNYGYYSPKLSKSIAFLIKSQQTDGCWKRIPLYGGHTDKAMYGSAELTTAFCIEALTRYQQLYANAEHKEKQEEAGKVVVQSLKTQEIDKVKEKKSFLLLFRIIRSHDWWLYKISPLLAIAYAEILLLNLPVFRSALTVSALLLSITCVAAYGYIVNDIFDIEVDRKAGKSNAMAQFQPKQRFLFCLLFVATGFAVPLLMKFGTLAIILLAINYLLPTLYSAPPLRLKERGIWGILSDSAGAHLTPTLFVAATFLHLSTAPQPTALTFSILAAAWAFFAGVRDILLHQLWDRDNDLNAAVSTFVTQFQPESVRLWINRLVFPCEIIVFAGLAVVLSQISPWLLGFFTLYALVTLTKLNITQTPLDPSPPIGQNIIPHDLYEVWLPLALAILLVTRNPVFLIFFCLTLVLFYPSINIRTMEIVNVFQVVFNHNNPAMEKTREKEQLEEQLANLREQLALKTQELEAQQLETLQAKTETERHRESLQQFQLQAQKQIEQLQTQLQEAKIQLQQTQSELQISQTELTQSQSELQISQTELAQSQSELQTSQTELAQLKTYLQQTQGVEGLISYYRSRIASNPDDIQLYHQALTIKPDDGQILLQLGNALVRQNRPKDAISTYQTALQHHPDNFEIHLELGKALEKEKKWEDAIASYRRAIALNPDYSWSHKYLGDILAERGQINEASLCYRRALQLQPRIFSF